VRLRRSGNDGFDETWCCWVCSEVLEGVPETVVDYSLSWRLWNEGGAETTDGSCSCSCSCSSQDLEGREVQLRGELGLRRVSTGLSSILAKPRWGRIRGGGTERNKGRENEYCNCTCGGGIGK
jgi:hypothetical protein